MEDDHIELTLLRGPGSSLANQILSPWKLMRPTENHSQMACSDQCQVREIHQLHTSADSLFTFPGNPVSFQCNPVTKLDCCLHTGSPQSLKPGEKCTARAHHVPCTMHDNSASRLIPVTTYCTCPCAILLVYLLIGCLLFIVGGGVVCCFVLLRHA